MTAFSMITDAAARVPRVVVAGLASCFGCQLQITNAEQHLTEILGQIDLRYWQLVTSEDMPEDGFDVAIIEGAVTTRESVETCKALREKAAHVMAIGACACTGGVPGMASNQLDVRIREVYAATPDACGELITPRPVSAVIEVDSEVRCCPIDPYDFVAALQRALYGSNRFPETRTMCADCKRNETECFYTQGTLCLGLVTRAGCGARCVNLGRPCNGCAGLSPDANLEGARLSCKTYGVSVEAFDKALEMFNQVEIAG